MKLSEHFTLAEMTKSEKATEHRISNTRGLKSSGTKTYAKVSEGLRKCLLNRLVDTTVY